MGGLEEIIKQINADAKSECDEIISKANDACKAIENEAMTQIEKLDKAGEKKAAADAKLEYEKKVSAAMMEAKQQKLLTKQKIIADIIDKAYEKLGNMETEKYFDILLKIIEEYAQPQSGMICLSQKDMDRVPVDFETYADAIAKRAGGSLRISDKAAEIENGMILDYGDIEENCTFAALFDNKKEILQDKINNLLFK